MNGYGLVAAVVWAGVLIYAIRRADTILRYWIATQAPTGTPPSSHSLPLRSQVEIPDDLVAYANGESEPWARDEVQKAIKEKYLEHYQAGDLTESWNRVRRAYGLGDVNPV